MTTHNSITTFCFESVDFAQDTGDAVFVYSCKNNAGEVVYTFTETVSFGPVTIDHISEQLFSALLRDLHLALGISYYKLFCPESIQTPYALTSDQAQFWSTVYRKGLGEFAFKNNIPLARVARFSATSGVVASSYDVVVADTALVGIGGGKDSIVALQLLRSDTPTAFVLETDTAYGVIDDTLAIANVPTVRVRRTLDHQLHTGVPGAYDGHIPISSLYAFVGIAAAILHKHTYVVVGNEHSSNFGNVEYDGETINHQWSKSAEFEVLLQQYVHDNLTPSVRYFSILRPFYELRIAHMFARTGTQFFEHFSSCNRNFSSSNPLPAGKKWCGVCAKCASTFLLLAPFVVKETLVDLFDKNLLADDALVPLYNDLLGFGAMKPFDCVGTFDELQAALHMVRDTYADTAIVRAFGHRVLHQQPEVFLQTQQAPTVPTRFRLAGMDSVLILGYGREGKATEQFLHTYYPHIRVGIADQQDGDDYLQRQEQYDVIVKTPVIPGAHVTRPYTTATNIFFAMVPRSQIIVVTGSKGKSTTASLVHAMLVAGGKKSRLIGNIGIPVLNSIMETPVQPDECLVCELSSYQLADLDVSPHIAGVTVLFPEHLDHHGTKDQYYEAKRNVTRFQTADDIFVYGGDDTVLADWATRTRAQAVPVRGPAPFAIDNPRLPGAHNLFNAHLAYTIAAQCGVSQQDAQKAANAYGGLPHRIEQVGTYKDITFYDDAISTTPESTIAALQALGTVHTIFLGGTDRGYDFTELEKKLREHGVQNIVLFPDSGARILSDESPFAVLHTNTMDEAVQFAYAHTPPGGTCLLSCASPSYSLWKNFEAKGDAFVAAVRAQAGV